MAEPARVPIAIDVAVQQTLDLCGGDAINALRIALIATAFLEAEIDRLSAEVSSGYGRRKIRKKPAARPTPATSQSS